MQFQTRVKKDLAYFFYWFYGVQINKQLDANSKARVIK